MRYVIAAHNAVDRMDAKWFKVVVNAHLLEGPLIIHRVRSLHRGSKKKIFHSNININMVNSKNTEEHVCCRRLLS